MSLRLLYAIRDVSYDHGRFKDAVRSRLDDDDPRVRSAALGAMLQVDPTPADVDESLRVLARHPEDTSGLITVAWMSKGRVEGELADLYVQALAHFDGRDALNVANQLRGLWVTAEVENAVLDARRRSEGGGLWPYVLGQMRPTRAPRVRAIFEALKKEGPNGSDGQLLERALGERELDPEAAPVAASLAAELLPSAPSSSVRQMCLRVLQSVGTSVQYDAVHAFATNPMVADDLRAQAGRVADTLARRR